jgi:hypothetical protein
VAHVLPLAVDPLLGLEVLVPASPGTTWRAVDMKPDASNSTGLARFASWKATPTDDAAT